MEAEITNLRQEVSQLRAQLSSAQLSSLDYDNSLPVQKQYNSEAGTICQSLLSPPTTTVSDNSNHKRKANDISGDPDFRAREFRNEMNKRQAMPPPPLPPSAQRVAQQYSDNRQEEQYSGKGQEQHQEQRVEYSNQFQQLGHSPRKEVYRDQSSPRGNQSLRGNGHLESTSTQQHFPVGYEGQFIDLTGSVGTSMRPQPLQTPQGGFINQQKQDGNQLRKDYANNISIPFQSPINPIPSQGTGGSNFTFPDHQSSKAGTEYGDRISPSMQGNRSTFNSLEGRVGNFLPLARQGENAGYLYDRGGQSVAPRTPRTSEIGIRSVVSPFFTEPLTKLGGPGLQPSAAGNGIRRPASVASFAGQRGNLSRSYGASLEDSGLFSRQDDSLDGRVRGIGATEVPNWSTPRFGKTGMFSGGGEIRPGTVQGFGKSEGGNMFNRGIRSGLGGASRNSIYSTSGSRILERPGLRRSVRRD